MPLRRNFDAPNWQLPQNVRFWFDAYLKLKKIKQNAIVVQYYCCSTLLGFETCIKAVCASWNTPTRHHACASQPVPCRCKGSGRTAVRKKLAAYTLFLFFQMKAYIISFLLIYRWNPPWTPNIDFSGPPNVQFSYILHVARN